ncbi:MAG: molybdenum cofactor guanylyltransferase [Candidatus Eremiobacteraeota bacterium]|nr:molybdenum cofactor guanylyltransferase [Candidatus Eremiobacteraeota bacterium]
MAERAGATAVVMLAGGEARRFPGKLEHCIDGRPMIVGLYERVRAAGWPVYIAGKASFSPEVDAQLDAPLLVDRTPGRGPLSALLSACAAIRAERVFAVAADQPRLETAVLDRLASSWRTGDEAVLPEHGGRVEPLAALYARSAVLREGFALRKAHAAAMRDLVNRLATRFVPFDGDCFSNVNSPADLT